MRNINWDKVQEATDFVRPEPGGYIVKITRVEDNEQKEYLRIEYDFVEGELKDYYKQLYESRGFWGGSFIRSYKEKALPFFKGFKTAVEESNKTFVFQNNPRSLVGKLVGVVLAEEEYRSNAGEVKTRLYVDQIRSIHAIRNEDFATPPLKRLPQDEAFSAPPSGGYSSSLTPLDGFEDDDPFAGLGVF